MNKLMCSFVTTTKKKKRIPDPNLKTRSALRASRVIMVVNFLGQLVRYSRVDITWMLKAKQSSEIALYPMLQLFINN